MDGIVLESKQLWVLGNFSRFIRPGMQRVEAGFAGAPASGGLMISAYRDPEGKKLVMVIINEEGQEQQLTLPETLAGRSVETFTTDARRNLEKSFISGDYVSVPPRSVTTL